MRTSTTLPQIGQSCLSSQQSGQHRYCTKPWSLCRRTQLRKQNGTHPHSTFVPVANHSTSQNKRIFQISYCQIAAVTASEICLQIHVGTLSLFLQIVHVDISHVSKITAKPPSVTTLSKHANLQWHHPQDAMMDQDLKTIWLCTHLLRIVNLDTLTDSF